MYCISHQLPFGTLGRPKTYKIVVCHTRLHVWCILEFPYIVISAVQEWSLPFHARSVSGEENVDVLEYIINKPETNRGSSLVGRIKTLIIAVKKTIKTKDNYKEK